MSSYKKRPIIDPRKIRGSESHSFNRIKNFYSAEIEPIIKMLPDKKLGESFRQILKKYLIISLFTCMEHYFRSEGKYVVDNNNMAIQGLFSGDISFPLSELNQLLKEGSLTNGNIVASSFNFADLNQINYVVSKLLNLDYLDCIHKLNDIDQTRYVLDGHPIPLDYGKLNEAYQMRNEIVHELKNPRISNWGLLCLWDNMLNMMDISVSVFLAAGDPNLRSSLDSDYQWGIEREKKKRMYELYSNRIIKSFTKKVRYKFLSMESCITSSSMALK
jgi:hypothetical protein